MAVPLDQVPSIEVLWCTLIIMIKVLLEGLTLTVIYSYPDLTFVHCKHYCLASLNDVHHSEILASWSCLRWGRERFLH